jgi:hypothetical protein
MIRVSTLIWVMLVALSGYAMFQVKSEVERLDRRLATVNRMIADDREEMRTLNVEWATLTQPDRLDALSQHVLQLEPIRTYMLGSLDQPPLRDDLSVPSPTTPPAAPGSSQLAEVSLRARQ